MTDLDYKLQCVDQLAANMKQKLREKEPRPSWRETPHPLEKYAAWLLVEIGEMLTAPPDQVWREAADVANLAMIYADVRSHLEAQLNERDVERVSPAPWDGSQDSIWCPVHQRWMTRKAHRDLVDGCP